MRILILYPVLLVYLIGGTLMAQNTTISKKESDSREVLAKHKVMLIPFEPKLYMGEIDYNINAETKLSSKQIKFKFRDGVNEQLYKSFKSAGYQVLDLMDDTTKYKKDLEGIYQFLSYDYQKTPNQENYKAPEKEKKDKAIEKGQLVVETNSDSRFMNAKITNAKVVPYLYGKYKTDLFVFINQLDIKAAQNNSNDGSAGKRLVRIHYTVYTYDAKEINSGIAEEAFEIDVNNPKKIIDKYISKLAATIVFRVNKGLGIR